MAENTTSNNVALEIVKKLTPRLLAIILIGTLAALTLAMILTLFRGGSVNLKDMTFNVPDNQDKTITELEKDLAQCESKSENISKELKNHPTREALLQCENANSQTVQLKSLVQFIGNTSSADEAILKIKKLSKTREDYAKLKQNYFFKLFILERIIPQYGKSISTHYDGKDRRETYKLLQEILLELGFYNGDITGSQLPTKNAVTEFQQAYNKKLETDADMNETSVDAVLLQPLGHVGYRTLEAFRSWYRNNAV